MITLRRVVLTLLLAAAAVLAVVGFQLTKETNPRSFITNANVKDLYPRNGDLDLRQSTIGFQLVAGYTGRLSIDGDHVPDSEVRHVVGLNQFLYQPGPDKTLGALKPGAHSATAEIWPLSDPKQVSTQTWSFSAH